MSLAPALPATPAGDFALFSLDELEAFIAPRVRSFIEVGVALLAISERGLYAEAGYATFSDYVRQRWEIDRARAYRLCDAARVVQAIEAASPGEAPEKESQAHELAALLSDPDELVAVWQEAVARSEGKPTVDVIRRVRRERERRRSPSPLPLNLPEPPEFPAGAFRIYTILVQAAQEARSLGGAEVMSEARPLLGGDTAAAWRAGLDATAALCRELSAALLRGLEAPLPLVGGV